MKKRTKTPPPRVPNGQLTNQNSANPDELIDMLSIAQIGAALTLNSFYALLSQSPGRDALFNSASQEMVEQWLSELSEMVRRLTQSTSDHPRMSTFILKGCARTSLIGFELLNVHGELYTIPELPFED